MRNWAYICLTLLPGAAVMACSTHGESLNHPADTADEAVFGLDRMHRIDLRVAATDRANLHYEDDTRVPCDITFDETALQKIGIRLKGTGSSKDEGKPGFSLKFDEFIPRQTLFGLKKLLLSNSMQSHTFLNEHLGYDLARRAALPARRTAHAVVTLNGEVKGVYVIVEAVDKTFLRRYFGPEHGEGNLYEGPVHFSEDPLNVDLKNETKDGRSRADINALAEALRNTTNDQLEAKLSDLLDVEQALRAYAVEALADHWDGCFFGAHNFYLYHHPEDDRFVFVPHGMDYLFSAIQLNPFSRLSVRSLLAVRIRAHAQLNARYHRAVREVIGQAWDLDYLLARVDRVSNLFELLSGSDALLVADKDRYQAGAGVRDRLTQYTRDLEELLAATCGNTLVEAGEECDDGNHTEGDGCDPSCDEEAHCGDGRTEFGEACDDGNRQSLDGCSELCQPERPI